MVILEKHYCLNNTFIIGEYIINGCRTFTIDELDEVCSKHNVSLHIDILKDDEHFRVREQALKTLEKNKK